jgi:hypothetical protein
MARVSIKCAQAVQASRKNTVETLPQLPHSSVQNPSGAAVVCIKEPTFSSFMPSQSAAEYTGYSEQLTEMFRQLSPVSTQPITTTTTYI